MTALKQLKRIIKTSFVVGMLISTAQAHPVIFKDAVAVTAWNSPMMTDYWLTYGVTPRLAATARSFTLRPMGSPGPAKREFYFPQINFLVHRWNARDSQANVYVMAGYGLEKQGAKTGRAGVGMVEADWESRKYYISGKYEIVRLSQNHPLDYALARVGIAPYVAEYGALHTWFMIQAERQPEYFEKIQITPMLRFFYQNVLWEIGASTRGNWMANFMVHF